jgi:hypothetical protein
MGLTILGVAALIGIEQFNGKGTSYWFWAMPGLLLGTMLTLFALVLLVMKRWRAGATLLAAAVMAVSSVYLTRQTIEIAERLRLEKFREDYLAQIEKLPIIEGQRVHAFPWSDQRTFGPAYLVYDEADTLVRAAAPAPAAWTAQAEKTLIAEGCAANLDKLDVRHIADHFYVVGCQDKYD